jgi:hypothetical protein
MQSISPHPFSLRSILISFFHLCLGLHSAVSSFITKTMHEFRLLLFYACRISPYILLLNIITVITFCKEHKIRSSSLLGFFRPLIPSLLLGLKISACVLPKCQRPSFTPINYHNQNYGLCLNHCNGYQVLLPCE